MSGFEESFWDRRCSGYVDGGSDSEAVHRGVSGRGWPGVTSTMGEHTKIDWLGEEAIGVWREFFG